MMTTMTAEELTLTEQLRALGYEHRPRSNQNAGGRAVYRNLVLCFEGTASETWAWLRRSGQIA